MPEVRAKEARKKIRRHPVKAAPARRRRRFRSDNPFLVFLSGIFSLAFVFTLALVAVVYWGKLQAVAPGPLTAEKVVLVPKGAGLPEIADLLADEGVIENALLFQTLAQATRAQGKLKFGEYIFPPQASMARVLEILVQGKSILHQITVPEGLTSEQVVQKLREDAILIGEIREVPPEGTLLPETYRFSRGMTRQDMIDLMRKAHRKVLSEIWAQRDPNLPIKTERELVALASIVEKETGKPEERPRVAGVYVNRLRKNMRLQADPTVIYGLFGGKGLPPGRSILKSDLEKPTPYNTYAMSGLPAGPIANPGRASLLAAANPLRTNELFFVADGTGGHVFAVTDKEHGENVKRWRQIEKERNTPSESLPALPSAARPQQAQADGPTGPAALPKVLPVQPAKPKAQQ